MEMPKFSNEVAAPEKEPNKAQEEEKDNAFKSKFKVEVLMKAKDKKGKIIAEEESDVSKLVKTVEVEAANKEEAQKKALGMDFGNKVPEYIESVEELKNEKLKDEAVKILFKAFKEKRKSLNQDEVEIVAAALKMFDKETREMIFEEFKKDLAEPLAEKVL